MRTPIVITSVALVAGFLMANPAQSEMQVSPVAAPDGALGVWVEVGSGVTGGVKAIAVDPLDDTVYVGGSLSDGGGVTVSGIAAWDGSNWSNLSGGLVGATPSVNSLAYNPTDGLLYVGGVYASSGGVGVNNISTWDGSAWAAVGTGTNGAVNTIAVSDDTVYIGGAFTQAGGAPADRVATWSSSTWGTLGGFDADVYAIAVDAADDTVYAGGAFTATDGGAADDSYVAVWDGSGWTSLGVGLSSVAYSLGSSATGPLFVGGNFQSAGGVLSYSLAQWDGQSWSAFGSGLGGARIGSALLVDDTHGLLYVAGNFSSVAGVTATDIAVLDTGLNTWMPLRGSLGEGTNGSVAALAFADDSLSSIYVGGSFGTAGGVTAGNLAQYTWQAPEGSNAITRAWDDNSGFTLAGEGFIGVPATGGVMIGSTAATYTRDDSATITITSSLPSTAGTYSITVDGVGGVGTVGTFTRQAQPTPPPPVILYPPGPPTGVVAVAGDETVAVSWTAPVYTGSTAMTTYEVIGDPSGSCSVPATQTSCVITGLTNGTAYTFTARAANSVGWGAYSSASEPVTPVAPPPPPDPTILITGSRGDVRGKAGIRVEGATSDVSLDTVLRPWFHFAGQTEYSLGYKEIRLDDQGDFTWQRRTRKKIYIIIKTQDEAVRSNRLIIPANAS